MKFDIDENEIKYIKSLIDLTTSRVLEIGCGTGRLTTQLAQTAKHIVAIEPDEDLIAQNKIDFQDFGNITFTTDSVLDLPFENDSFDLVIFSLSLCCIDPPELMKTAVKEAVRVLQPSGKLFNITPSMSRKFNQGYFWHFIDKNSLNQVIDMEVSQAIMALKQVCFIDKKMNFIEEGRIPTTWEFDSHEELRQKWIKRYEDNVSKNDETHRTLFTTQLEVFLQEYSRVFPIEEEYQLFEK